VGQQVAEGDGLFAAAGELRQEFRDLVVEVEQAALPEQRAAGGGERLGGRQPDVERVRRHRLARLPLAEDELETFRRRRSGRAARDRQLGAELLALLDAAQQQRPGFGQIEYRHQRWQPGQ
jgi:hypothetical protein